MINYLLQGTKNGKFLYHKSVKKYGGGVDDQEIIGNF